MTDVIGLSPANPSNHPADSVRARLRCERLGGISGVSLWRMEKKYPQLGARGSMWPTVNVLMEAELDAFIDWLQHEQVRIRTPTPTPALRIATQK